MDGLYQPPHISILAAITNLKETMGSKAPTWADQWGEGNNKDVDYDKSELSSKAGHGGGNKMDNVKAAASAGFDKAKVAATVGAKKLKSGSSMGFKWIKEKCQKKSST